jgi:predicted transcriptional regulator of viral defense system
MKVDEWLSFFREHKRKKISTLSDIVTLSDEKKASLSVQLSRMAKAGIVENPLKGIYLNPFNTPSAEEIAMVLRYPSYLSMEYALSESGILSQHAFTLTLVTTGPTHTFTSEKHTYEYHQIKGSLFWGYKKEGSIQIAHPEKALLDLIYIRYTRNRSRDKERIFSLMDDMYLDELDQEMLSEYSRKFDPVTASFLEV